MTGVSVPSIAVLKKSDGAAKIGRGSSTVDADLTAEAQARSNADGTLQDNINAEAQARSNADDTLQDNIDAEAQARSNADGTLQDNIDAEAQARADAFAGLSSPLWVEIGSAAFTDALAVDFTEIGNPDDYSFYFVVGEIVPQFSNRILKMQVYESGSLVTTGYTANGSNTDGFFLDAAASGFEKNFTALIQGAAGGKKTAVKSGGLFIDGPVFSYSGNRTVAALADGFRIMPSADTISGNIVLYGVKKGA